MIFQTGVDSKLFLIKKVNLKQFGGSLDRVEYHNSCSLKELFKEQDEEKKEEVPKSLS